MYYVLDFGDLYAIFLDNELIFGFDRPLLSIKLECFDFVYEDGGIVLYGCADNGLLRSSNALSLTSGTYLAMHDASAEIKPLNGARIIPNEIADLYSFVCTNGENTLTLSLEGNCRLEGNVIRFRRGRTTIALSEPTVSVTPKRKGFGYEAERCLTLMNDLSSDSDLLPLLLLVDSLENAAFNSRRAENVKSLLADMTAADRETAEAVLHRYYRAFGINNTDKRW